MAGAVSAGAYTAGVLDFLTEALDAWYAAKARGDLVPTHDVSLDVLSGASAGGMCAALAAVMLAEPIDHIRSPLAAVPSTRNRLFEAWVNRIDITQLLETTDLPRHASPDVISLLDSSVIDTIAAQFLTPTVPPSPRPWVSPSLTLFLSLTNLRGVPYSLTGAAPGSVEETTFFYGDRICFQTRLSIDPRPDPKTPAIHPLTLDQPGPDGGWATLQSAAMATGAFPLFLRPRTLDRTCEEYTPPLWESVAPFQKPQTQKPQTPPASEAAKLEGAPPCIPPSFPPKMKSALETLNVDGGITNNDPFTYAHDFLASLAPNAQDPNAPNHDPLKTDRAVISIAPFPTTTKFDRRYSAAANAGILRALPSLVAALISQSRFFGESLNRVMDGTTFNRFIIAPADDHLTRQHSPTGPKSHLPEPPALQCACLGAFGGFFERGFRAHDFALGRQNCHTFLSKYFVLPAANTLMRAALDALPDADRETILRNFRCPAPTTYATKPSPAGLPGPPPVPVAAHLAANPNDPYAGIWLPIIPLCRQALPHGVPQLTDRLPPVPRQSISAPRLHRIVGLILRRFRTVTSVSLGLVTFWPLRAFLRPGPWFIALLARRPLTRRLAKELGDAYKP